MASTTLPAASAFTGASVTEGQFKTAITDLRTMINEVLGDNSTGTQGAKAGFVMLGVAYINDSSNVNMTIGLTINQAGNDNEVIAFKSSDIAHGITGFTETDTFGYVQKTSSAGGGVLLRSVNGSNATSLQLSGIAGTDDTTKSTAGTAPVILESSKKDTTTNQAMGANANLVVIRDAFTPTTRFIFDAEGDSHQDVGTAWTNFDDHEDVQLLTALSVHVSKKSDPIRGAFRKFLRFNRKGLERLKLVTFNRNGHHFVNMSKLTMLLTGAVRQLAAEQGRYGVELAELRKSCGLLVGRLATIEKRLAA